jgi:hypothetical protein
MFARHPITDGWSREDHILPLAQGLRAKPVEEDQAVVGHCGAGRHQVEVRTDRTVRAVRRREQPVPENARQAVNPRGVGLSWIPGGDMEERSEVPGRRTLLLQPQHRSSARQRLSPGFGPIGFARRRLIAHAVPRKPQPATESDPARSKTAGANIVILVSHPGGVPQWPVP